MWGLANVSKSEDNNLVDKLRKFFSILEPYRYLVVFISSYLIVANLYFVVAPLLFSDHLTWDFFYFYWGALLIIPFIVAIMSTAHIGLFALAAVFFCVPTLLLWLSYRTKNRARSDLFSILGGAILAGFSIGAVLLIGQAG